MIRIISGEIRTAPLPAGELVSILRLDGHELFAVANEYKADQTTPGTCVSCGRPFRSAQTGRRCADGALTHIKFDCTNSLHW